MNMSKSRDIQAKMPSPKVIYASNESKSVLARNLEECRDNDKNRKACFYRLNAFWLVTVKVLNSYSGTTNVPWSIFAERFLLYCKAISRKVKNCHTLPRV